ncbi:hypothetical protein AXG93_4492s1500 [Marchantia polymorpha subsp. ruderalis]|uniref:Uncharacterized protein n=1 Tax=Marchantia polymorpha subsp. ruderalis TaxID=1480154 RepID=A0A176W5H2_MARPO|nr:hypothetical protein AXG93_4492s1500 [Marchantia polymorpha subsp. ruderalis]
MSGLQLNCSQLNRQLVPLQRQQIQQRQLWICEVAFPRLWELLWGRVFNGHCALWEPSYVTAFAAEAPMPPPPRKGPSLASGRLEPGAGGMGHGALAEPQLTLRAELSAEEPPPQPTLCCDNHSLPSSYTLGARGGWGLGLATYIPSFTACQAGGLGCDAVMLGLGLA